MAYAQPNQRYNGCFQEKQFKKYFEYLDEAPNEWCAQRGATHTVYVGGLGETRPAKILKTVAYVGVDEENNDLVWEKWNIKKCY